MSFKSEPIKVGKISLAGKKGPMQAVFTRQSYFNALRGFCRGSALLLDGKESVILTPKPMNRLDNG